MAYSYESSRTSAYSEDLQWMMVWQREALGIRLLQTLAYIDKSTVQGLCSYFLTVVVFASDHTPRKRRLVEILGEF